MAAGRSIRAGEAFVEVGVRDKVTAALAKIQARAAAFAGGVETLGRGLLTVSLALAAPLAVSIKAASDMEETMNKFNVVFAESAREVKQWGDTLGGELGRSKQQMADFLAGTQDLLVPMGFAADEAIELSKQVSQLAIDLASFNNMADADVLRDLHAALTGSGEVMKKYGVIVSEAAVKQELLNQGLDPKTATEQQKALARMNIILRGTTAAHGDAARSAGGFANQVKRLQANIADAAAEAGETLLPMVTEMVGQISEAVKAGAAWVASNEDLVKTLAKVALGSAVAGGGAIALSKSIVSVNAGVTLATNTIKGLVAAMRYLGAVNSTLIGFTALTLAIVAIVEITRRARREINGLADALRKTAEQSREAHRAAATAVETLERMAGLGRLTPQETAEAEELIAELTRRFGDLGLRIDETTGELEGFGTAAQELRFRVDAQALESADATIADIHGQLRMLDEEFRAASGFWSNLGLGIGDGPQRQAEIEAETKRLNDLLDQQIELRAELARQLAAGGGADPKLRERLAAIQAGIEAERELAKLNAEEARRRESDLDREIRQIQELTIARLKLLDAMIEAAKADPLGIDLDKLDSLLVTREAVVTNANQEMADLRAREAARRDAPNVEARREIERLKVELELDGVDEQIALLAIDLEEALAAAAEQGLDPNLIREQFALREQLLRQGAAIGQTVRQTASVTGSEQARGLSGRAAPAKLEEKQLKAQERIEDYAGEMVEELRQLNRREAVFAA